MLSMQPAANLGDPINGYTFPEEWHLQAALLGCAKGRTDGLELESRNRRCMPLR
jgi:hypothetical protein